MVIVELIDFTIHKDEFQIGTSSSDHDDRNNNIQYLLNLLKSTVRNNPYKPFSLEFKQIGTLSFPKGENNFGIAVSEKHNVLVASHGVSLVFYNRIISSQSPIPDTMLFKVNFNVELKYLNVNRENDQEYLYVATFEPNTILKINLGQLLISKEQSIIWTSEPFYNLWGIEIMNDRVYVMDCSAGIIVLDCDSGKTIEDSSPRLPEINKSYQVLFTSPTEMVISHNCCVELFKITKAFFGMQWKAIKRSPPFCSYIFSMFYEKHSSLIYLANGDKIHVINAKDLSLVKSFGDVSFTYGMCIDRLSGLLYICNPYAYLIDIYQ